jgi:TP901 family phage tail tape measure protein
MAEETISTRIVANADFSALIADVHRVTSSLSKLQEQLANSNKMLANQIAVMNRSFSDTLRSTGQYSTHFVSLQSDVEKFGKNLDGGKLKLNQYFNTFRQHAQQSGGLIRDLAKQQVALQNSVLQPLGRNAQGLMQFNVHVPRGLDEIKNKTAIARQELQIMNKVIQDGAGQLINWGKNTQWAGRQLTVGLTVPLIAFGAQAAKAFREADQELVRLTKVYGDVAGTSAAELGRVRDDVVKTSREISAAMGVSFKETIGLAADIAATGKTGDELLGSIKETTRLAVLGEVDRQEAMKATLAIQSAFKQNTDELSQSINFLNAVENQTSTTLNDLVEAIPKAGPVIQGLGGSVQDLALYLTAMREGGINASEGANALKSALASLINPTDVAQGKFKALGIDLLSIVNDNAGNLTGTLMELQGALDRLNPLQKQQAIEQLFGKFQFSRLNALFENLGREGSQTLKVLDLMKTSTSDLASVADRELAAVTESASGKYRRAIESLRASLAEVGEQFLKINTVLIQVIDKVVQFANNLPGPVKQVLALAGGFTAVIGPVIMLTGVLANFFGYILKGIFHMKAFFKGGEGWKYLTPEMLAAEKAGRLVEQSFYSDAKAAAVLKQALGNLIDEFSILEAKAKSGAMSVNPAVSTMAGNLVMAAGGSRVVNPDHPLAGAQGTRASSHMVPRAGMTEAQRLQQTIFGMVPGSIPVNQKIGQNPQIYMNEPLPNVPGVTSVNGVSTGIVSGEAARWHAMMATLGMQSKVEIETLKKTIAATGTVSKEFMMQFDDILPVVSKLTDNAARESALIVAELRAGKLSVEAAKAKIIALNLETERMIASAVQSQAGAMGRTINTTMVPTLNQPVVDPTGKSNMRELFKKGRTRDFINKISGILGVRTSGAGYNIETTVPKKFNQGNIVPGTGNTDTVPAMLTPGEFVVNKEATAANLPLLQAINNGQQSNTGEYNIGGIVQAFLKMTKFGGQKPMVSKNLIDKMFPGRLTSRANAPYYEPKGNAGVFGGNVAGRKFSASTAKINKDMETEGVDPRVLLASVNARGGGSRLSTDVFLDGLVNSGVISKSEKRRLSKLIFNSYARKVMSMGKVNDKNNPVYSVSEELLRKELASNPIGLGAWDKWSRSPGSFAHPTRRSSTGFLNQIQVGGKSIKFSNLEASKSNKFYHSKEESNPFIKILSSLFSTTKLNRGGAVGNVLKSTAFKNLGARFGKMGDNWGATALSIGMGKKLFGSSGLTPKAQNLMYGKLIQNLEKERPYGYVKDAQGHLKKALEPDIVDALIKSSAGDVLSTGGKSLSKIDREILRTKYANWDNKSWTPSTSKIRKQMFGMNSGGMVPGTQYLNSGGMVKGVQYLRRGSKRPVEAAPSMGGGMASSFGGMGLMAAGSMIGGGAGQLMSSAGMAMTFMPMLRMIPKVNSLMDTMKNKMGVLSVGSTKLSDAFTKKAGSLTGLSKGFGPVLRGLGFLAKGFGPVGLAITGTILAVKGLTKLYKDHQEELRINRLEYGMSSEAIKKAGYSMSDYGANIKKAVADSKALQERNTMLYESMFQANIPIKMTIAEYKKLRKETKEKMPDLIELFNQKGNSEVGAVASRLKAQFMSLGDNVETATAKVYALMSQSNKAQLAAGAIGTKGFGSIKTAVDAAVSSAGNFDDAMADGDAKAAADSLMIAFEGIGNAIKDNAKKNKLEFGDSMDQVLKKMATTGKGQVAINQEVLDELKKQNPELAKILNSTDTATSAWAKYQLALQGVNLDLQTLSGEAANAALKLQSLVVSNTTATLKNTAGIKEQYAKYEGLQKRIKDLQKAAQGQSAKQQIDSRKVIEGLNEQIKKIKDAADAKIKALRAQSQAENDNLELQKLQLEYQQAIARGDQDAAARSQIAIQQLTNQVQTKKAEEAIIAKAELDIKPIQDKIDKLGKKNQELADKAALAGESLSKLQAQSDGLKDKLSGLEKALSSAAFNKLIMGDAYEGSAQQKTDLAGVESFNRDLGGPKSVEKVIPKGAKARHRIPETFSNTPGGAKDLLDKTVKEMSVQASVVNLIGDIKGSGTTGGKGLVVGGANAYNFMGDRTSKGNPLQVPTDSISAQYVNEDGTLNDGGDKYIISALKLQKGEFFKFNGKTYEVLKTGWGFGDRAKPLGRSLGGPVTPGRKYEVNDRINSLGRQQEIFMPTMPGVIKPNIDTAFNIPSQQTTRIPNISNSPNSNNIYNIDIELNGTNVTVDDVMKSMEAKMKLVGATLGRPVNVGGKY